MSWSQLLSWCLLLPLDPCSVLLPPSLDSSPRQALFHHWPKFHFLALSSPDYSLTDQQKIHPSAPLAHAGDRRLLMSPRKLDGPV
jgi:hypothetical protein